MNVPTVYYIAIRCTKTVEWFRRTFDIDDVIELPGDVKVIINHSDRIPYHTYPSNLFARVTTIFGGGDNGERNSKEECIKEVKQHQDWMILFTETLIERVWRLTAEAEQKRLKVDTQRINNLAVYTKYLDAPHGKPEFSITERMMKMLVDIDSGCGIEYFLIELLRDAVMKLTRLMPITASLADLRSVFSGVFVVQVRCTKSTPAFEKIRESFEMIHSHWYDQLQTNTARTIALVPPIPGWLHGYFYQFLALQNHRGFNAAFRRSLGMFLLGGNDDASMVSWLPREILRHIAMLTIAW